MTTGVSAFKIPTPWRDRPTFDGKTAGSLKRFIRNIRIVIEQGKITDVKVQKSTICSYLEDEDIREQWMTLPKFESGTLDEWLKEIEELYPELKTVEIGSLRKLRTICKKHEGLTLEDRGAVLRFNLSFLTEANKLMVEPALITNLQLVEMYLDVLDEDVSDQVRTMMHQMKFWTDRGIYSGPTGTSQAATAASTTTTSTTAGTSTSTTTATPAAQTTTTTAKVEREEDSLPIKEVMNITESLAKSVSLGLTDGTRSNGLANSKDVGTSIKKEFTAKFDLFKEELAKIRDSQELMEKQSAQVEERLGETIKKQFAQSEKSYKATFEQQVRQLPPHMESNSNHGDSNHNHQERQYQDNRQGGYNQGGYNSNNNYARPDDRKCFYCNGDHLIKDCGPKFEHIDAGKIIIENGAIRLPGGQYLPNSPPWKTKKERVDDYYARGAGRTTGPLSSSIRKSSLLSE